MNRLERIEKRKRESFNKIISDTIWYIFGIAGLIMFIISIKINMG